MTRTCKVGRTALLLLAVSAPATTVAQPARPASRPATPAVSVPSPPAPAPVPSTPQQTTASFADWTLRCARPANAPAICEVVQSVVREDRTVAQVAIGRPNKGQPLQITVLVPPSVSFAPAPSLLAGREGADTPVAQLAWRRCLPGGCVADATLGDEVIQRLRGWTEPGRIVFADAANRPAVLPFSARGLTQALDALAKEEAT